MRYYSTREAAKRIGIRPDTLQKAVWLGRVQAPTKGPGGAFLWALEDMQRASWALLRRAYDPGEEGNDHGRA